MKRMHVSSLSRDNIHRKLEIRGIYFVLWNFVFLLYKTCDAVGEEVILRAEISWKCRVNYSHSKLRFFEKFKILKIFEFSSVTFFFSFLRNVT